MMMNRNTMRMDIVVIVERKRMSVHNLNVGSKKESNMNLTNFNVDASNEGKSADEPGNHVPLWQVEEEDLSEGSTEKSGCE